MEEYHAWQKSPPPPPHSPAMIMHVSRFPWLIPWDLAEVILEFYLCTLAGGCINIFYRKFVSISRNLKIHRVMVSDVPLKHIWFNELHLITLRWVMIEQRSERVWKSGRVKWKISCVATNEYNTVLSILIAFLSKFIKIFQYTAKTKGLWSRYWSVHVLGCWSSVYHCGKWETVVDFITITSLI